MADVAKRYPVIMAHLARSERGETAAKPSARPRTPKSAFALNGAGGGWRGD